MNARLRSRSGFSSVTIFLFLALLLLVGCGTPFEYTPKHNNTYSSIANNKGVEILKGTDVRERKDRKGVKWNKPVEDIVAEAVSDELKHAHLFLRVDKSGTAKPLQSDVYSHMICFKVKRLRLYNPANAGDIAGGAALGLLGLPGVFIAASIPTKWESSAEVEFEVFDAQSNQPVFKKMYSATRSLEANAYAGMSKQKRQSSEALEQVVKEFITDLAALPLSTGHL